MQGETRRYVVGSVAPAPIIPITTADLDTPDSQVREALYEVERAFMDVLFTHDRADLLALPRETPDDESRQASFVARWRPILQALCTSAKPKPALPTDPPCTRCDKRRASVNGLCFVCLNEDAEALHQAVTRL